MKIDKTEENGNIMKFVLKDARHSEANAIRRAATGMVQTFAINSVTFYENTSAMFDEYIAHRIGLVPIKTPRKPSESEEVVFTLDATGPKTVYSSELQTSDKEVCVANDKIPLIKLGKEQKLKIECKASVGIGYNHAKFQPGMLSYEDVAEGTFNFYLESFGQMKPQEILDKAISYITDELKDTAKNVKKL